MKFKDLVEGGTYKLRVPYEAYEKNLRGEGSLGNLMDYLEVEDVNDIKGKEVVVESLVEDSLDDRNLVAILISLKEDRSKVMQYVGRSEEFVDFLYE